MDLPKAIDIITRLLLDRQDLKGTDFTTAFELGIEALKHIQKQRRFNLAFSDELLPGETTEPPPPHQYTGGHSWPSLHSMRQYYS